jgi:chemotaxis protein CheC
MGQLPKSFSEFQLDALREIGNIGAGNAATALSQMVGHRIDMSLTKAQVLATDSIAEYLGGMEQNVAAVHMPIYGDICGVALVFFPLERVGQLCGLLTGKEDKDPFHLTEMGQSALKELGSILTGAYLSSLFRLMSLQMIHGVPGLAIDMAQAVLDTVLVELEQKEEIAIVIENQFLESDKKLTGNFFLLPESGSLQKLFDSFTKSLGLPGNG